jgi:hypothetical protein
MDTQSTGQLCPTTGFPICWVIFVWMMPHFESNCGHMTNLHQPGIISKITRGLYLVLKTRFIPPSRNVDFWLIMCPFFAFILSCFALNSPFYLPFSLFIPLPFSFTFPLFFSCPFLIFVPWRPSAYIVTNEIVLNLSALYISLKMFSLWI